MARCPFAEWRGPLPSSNYSAGGNTPIGLVVHHVDGSLAAADATFSNPSRGASAHFGIGFDGHIIQWVDTSDVAYAQCKGNWLGWVSVENASDPERPDDPPTAAQVESMGRLVQWLGTPPVPATSMTSGGVAYHRQFPGPCAESFGQTDCPGDGFVAAIPAICAAASGNSPKPPKKKDDDPMLYVFNPHTPTEIWCLAGNTRRHVTPDEWKFVEFTGGKAVKISAAWFDSFPEAA